MGLPVCQREEARSYCKNKHVSKDLEIAVFLTPDFIRAAKLAKFFRSGSGSVWDMRGPDANGGEKLRDALGPSPRWPRVRLQPVVLILFLPSTLPMTCL